MKFKDTRRGLMKYLPIKIVLCRRKNQERRKSLKGKSTRVTADDNRCACCLQPFLIERGVECGDCGVRSCRKICSHRDISKDTWHCLFCHQRRSWLGRNEKWFETFGGVFSEDELNRYFNTTGFSVRVQEVEENEQPELDLELATGGEKEKEEDPMEAVRDFIEQIVWSLVSDVKDAPPVDRFHNHPTYKPSPDSPTMAHMALRGLVERAVEEVRKLPGLGGSRQVTEKSSQDARNSIVEHSYEDLLATAILNKVIEKFQNEHVDGNSNVLHDISSSRTKCGSNENEFGLDEGVDEGSSSLEPLSQDECSSDCSASRSKYFRNHQEPLSLTIEERIEEVTTTYTSDEDLANGKNQSLNIRKSRRVPFPEFGMDIVDPSQESSEDSQDELDGSSTAMMDLITPSESWEENWLFQRKKTGTKADSVAMLVPHPSAEFKALIGDKDAEDTSDLSECSAQSDEEIEKELMEVIQNVIPRSPKQEPEEINSYNEDSHRTRVPSLMREKLRNHEDKFESKEKSLQILQEVDQSFCSTDKINLVQVEKFKSSKPREVIEVEIFLPKTEEERAVSNDSINIDRNFVEDEYTRHHAVPMYISLSENSETPTTTVGTKNPNPEDFEGSTTATTAAGLSNQESRYSTCRDSAKSSQPIITTPVAREMPNDEKNSLNLLATPPRPGTIAEREHRKWENAVPIENNPYSEENIQKRLLARQYARKSSDISNSHAEPPKNASITNSESVDIILESNRPDIRRFSRDYYINNVKISSEDRSQRSPLTVSSSCSGSSSRPSSSLSQESGSDFERQEKTTTTQRYNEMTKWQKNNNNNNNNNIEMNKKANGMVMPATLCDYSDPELCGNHQEELLENERKNSKNEMNAKLNNQDALDANKPYSDDSGKRQLVIRRLNLKAYGFENEFGDKTTTTNVQVKTSTLRTINKLDLKSFGYLDLDGSSSLRRTRSVNHLDFDSADRSELKKRLVVRSNDKSNLDKSYDISQDNGTIAQMSYENQNFVENGYLKSAKSVPNIASIESHDDYHETHEKSVEKSENDTANNYFVRGKLLGDDETKEKKCDGINVDSKLPLPSVKKLVQAFGKNCETNPVPAPRLSKSSNRGKGRSTPDIHIIETPRQMHSLTARSLSKQFREGLRQLSTTNKVPSSKTSHNITNDPINIMEPTPSKLIENSPVSDIESIISPGKLKSNIKFWEQLQNKN